MNAMRQTPTHPGTQARSIWVRLTSVAPEAHSVCIAGTFNAWQANASPMLRVGDGQWEKELSLPPGTYEYCLVVDGEWRPDPLVGETIPNPFGGMNSVLRIPAPVPPGQVAGSRQASKAGA